MSLIRRNLISTIVAMGAVLAAASPTMASPSRTCTDYGNYVYCAYLQEAHNEHTTPSGITTIQAQLRWDATYTYDNGAVFTDKGTRHYHTVLRNNEPKEFHDHYTQQTHGGGYTCIYNFDVHYAGGEFQYSSFPGGCTLDE